MRERIGPDAAAEAMRVYAQEINRPDRERRLFADTIRRELAETAKAIPEIVRLIERGGWHLKAKQDNFTARLSDAP